jgi:hypothetical protein
MLILSVATIDWASFVETDLRYIAPLQVAYLLSIAGDICSYMPAFPFTPAIFSVLTKVDQAFVSLLKLSTPAQATPPSLHPPTKTDRVRIKSLAEEIRVVAVNTATASGISADIDDSSDDEFEGQSFTNNDVQVQQELDIGSGLGRIFKGTIEILGDSLT